MEMERDPLALDDDSVPENIELLVPKNETIHNIESVPESIELLVPRNETIHIIESVPENIELLVSRNETIDIIESVPGNIELLVPKNETIHSIESVPESIELLVPRNETIHIIESIPENIELLVPKNETIHNIESVPERLELLVPRNETIHIIEPIPIVYTKKLDDMTVFKMDVDLLTSVTIESLIIAESKPKLSHLNRPKKYPQSKSETSFQNMVQKLDKINFKRQENSESFCNHRSSEINSQVNPDTTNGDVTCIKSEPIEVLNEEGNCEIMGKTDECNSKSKKAIKRKSVDRQESNSSSQTEVTPDTVIWLKNGPLEVNTGSNREPGKKRKKNSSKSSIAIEREVESIKNFYSESKSKTPVDSLEGNNATDSNCDFIKKTKQHNSKLETKTNDFMSERQLELLKMCKPISIVLDDIGTPIGYTVKKYQSTVKKSKKVSNSIPNSNVTVENKTNPLTFDSIDLKKNLKGKFLLCYDEFSSELDMYYIDFYGNVMDYYRLVGDQSILNRTVLLPYIGDQDAVLLLCCCWYHRYKTVKTMWPRLISYSASKFLRKRHNCIPGDCICCCQNQSIETLNVSLEVLKSTSKDDKPVPSVTAPLMINETLFSIKDTHVSTENNKIHDLEKEISCAIIKIQDKILSQDAVKNKNVWLRQLLTTESDSFNVINKALSYSKQIPNNNEAILKPCMQTPDGICSTRFVTNDYNYLEWYELTKTGEVLTYTKRKQDLHSTKCTNICCWVRRELLIETFNFDLKKKTKKNICPATTFLRRPHMCPAGNCMCCCRKKVNSDHIITLVPLLDITLPKRTISTNSATVKQQNNYDSKMITTNPVNAINLTTNTAKATNLTTNPVKAANQTSPDSSQPVKIIPNLDTNTPEDQGVVDSLITTILDTFKDVRLTINEDGKVAAALQVPVNTLCTAELKVLSNILFHAQEQVKALGLRPGTILDNHIVTNTLSNATTQTPKASTQGASLTSPVKTNNAGIHLNKPNPANNSLVRPNTRLNLKENKVNKRTKQGSSTNQLGPTNLYKHYLPEETLNNYNLFSKICSVKSQQYKYSFQSHAIHVVVSEDTLFESRINVSEEPQIFHQSNVNVSKKSADMPIIENVFSLQSENSNSRNKDGCDLPPLRAICKKIKNGNASKEKINKDGTDVNCKLNKTSTPKRIRVISPSKLGVNLTYQNRIKTYTNRQKNPKQLRTMNSIESMATMIPDHLTKPVGKETNQSSMINSISGGIIQLQTQTDNSIRSAQQTNLLNNVNTQQHENGNQNVHNMTPFANKMLPQTPEINTNDISLLNQTNEVDVEDILDIPEFRIIKPTNSTPIQSAQLASKLYQPQVNNAKHLSHVNLPTYANHQILKETNVSMPTPIVLLVQPSGNLTLCNLNATPQNLINDTIHVVNNPTGSNSLLEKMLSAPLKPVQLEERTPESRQIEEDTKENMVIEIEHVEDKVSYICSSDTENKEDGKLENNSHVVFDEVGDCEVNNGPDDNENTDDNDSLCILGM